MFNGLGNINPDKRADDARDELREAERAYAAAEDRLIKARRAYESVNAEWRKFHFPRQQDFRS